MFNAAIDAYLCGLKKTHNIVPTLLSNRSQAFIMMEDWPNAFADAAASLTIRPDSEKTWRRYNLALEKLQNDALKEVVDKARSSRQILASVLQAHVATEIDEADDIPTSESSNVEILKKNGNNAFNIGDFKKAVKCYTKALIIGGEQCRALLSNWSLCALSIRGLNDCLASASASLRIAFNEKPFYQMGKALIILGEASLLSRIVREGRSTNNKEILKLCRVADNISNMMVSGSIRDPMMTMEASNNDLLPYWHNDIEIFDAGEKGRGVRAKVDIDEGQVVIIEHPVASVETSSTQKNPSFSQTFDEKEITSGNRRVICENIIWRSKKEKLLTTIVDKLYDGSVSQNKKPLVSFNELIPSLTSTSLLLPSLYEYSSEEKEDERVTLTAKQVQGLVSKNSHGNSDIVCQDGKFVVLYPAISMFNHSQYPTCGFPFSVDGKVSILMATRHVKAGEELTVCYCLDEEKARSTWGVK